LFYIVCMYVVVLMLPTYRYVSGFRPLPRMGCLNKINNKQGMRESWEEPRMRIAEANSQAFRNADRDHRSIIVQIYICNCCLEFIEWSIYSQLLRCWRTCHKRWMFRTTCVIDQWLSTCHLIVLPVTKRSISSGVVCAVHFNVNLSRMCLLGALPRKNSSLPGLEIKPHNHAQAKASTESRKWDNVGLRL